MIFLTDILLAATQLANELASEKEVDEILSITSDLHHNYQPLLIEYKRWQAKFDEVLSSGGRHHPDFKQVAAEYSLAKSALFAQPDFKRLIDLENTLENKLNELLAKIAKIISPNIKTPNELGLITVKRGCHAS